MRVYVQSFRVWGLGLNQNPKPKTLDPKPLSRFFLYGFWDVRAVGFSGWQASGHFAGFRPGFVFCVSWGLGSRVSGLGFRFFFGGCGPSSFSQVPSSILAHPAEHCDERIPWPGNDVVDGFIPNEDSRNRRTRKDPE